MATNETINVKDLSNHINVTVVDMIKSSEQTLHVKVKRTLTFFLSLLSTNMTIIERWVWIA